MSFRMDAKALAAINQLKSDPPERIVNEEGNCYMCLRPITSGGIIKVLRCGHAFHRDCFAVWLDRGHLHCPYCRLPAGSVIDIARYVLQSNGVQLATITDDILYTLDYYVERVFNYFKL